MQYFLKLERVTSQYIQWTILNVLYKTRRNSPLVHKMFNIPFESQEPDVTLSFLYLYTLYEIKGRTVTPMLHKLFLSELYRYYLDLQSRTHTL